MTVNDLQVRIEQLILQAQNALNNVRQAAYAPAPAMQLEEWSGLRAAGLAFIEATFGHNHPFYTEFDTKLRANWESDGKAGLGVLTAIRDHIKGGWLETTKGLVTAEVFAEFF